MRSDRHTIHGRHKHYGWDNSIAPVETIAPGTTLRFECNDAANGHFRPGSTAADVATLDFTRVNPVTGPVFVDGAEPGDALRITFGEFEPTGVGWTANIPGFGLLADQFPEPALHMWSYDAGTPALYGPGGKAPLKPFTGTIGLAPAEPGLHSVVPPRRVGGNLDVRDLAAGSVLWLPVEVAGGLFSVGDTHAAQGDGEVCGTAIESAMAVTLTFELEKGVGLKFPRFRTPGPVTRHNDGAGYDVTTGIGPDLMRGARDAVSGMIDLIAAREGMSAVEAYMLCSVAGDLRISCIVDAPNWVVSLYMPRAVFG
jgi:acetamidase/formamidase